MGLPLHCVVVGSFSRCCNSLNEAAKSTIRRTLQVRLAVEVLVATDRGLSKLMDTSDGPMKGEDHSEAFYSSVDTFFPSERRNFLKGRGWELVIFRPQACGSWLSTLGEEGFFLLVDGIILTESGNRVLV